MIYTREECCKIIRKRTDAIYADQKAFIYIRKVHKQHDIDGIGGGNLSMALTLFAVLDFLGKIQYFIDRKGKVEFRKNGDPKIEGDRAFTHIVGMMRKKSGVNLGLENVDNSEICKVWNDTRNKLTHVCTTTAHMETFLIGDLDDKLGIEQILAEIYKFEVFLYEKKGKFWRVNVDVLLARIPSITQLVCNDIMKKVENVWCEDLIKVIG